MAMTSGSGCASSRRTPWTASETASALGAASVGSAKRRAASSAWRCGAGRASGPPARVSRNRSPRTEKERAASASAGLATRSRHPLSRARSTPLRHSEVLPIPGGPSRITADNPERASSRKPPISESPFSRSVRLAASSGEAMEPSVIPLRSRCPGRAPAAL